MTRGVHKDQRQQPLLPAKSLPPGSKPLRRLKDGRRWVCLEQAVPCISKLLQFLPGTAHCDRQRRRHRDGLRLGGDLCVKGRHAFYASIGFTNIRKNATCAKVQVECQGQEGSYILNCYIQTTYFVLRAGCFDADLGRGATIFTFVAKTAWRLRAKFFPKMDIFHLQIVCTLNYSTLYLRTVSLLAKWTNASRFFSKSPKVCHFCELQEAAFALRTGWRIDGTGHLEGDMKKRQNQHTSVGRQGNTISSDARPREEAFQFRRLQQGGASRPHAEDAMPIPIYFNPGIQIFLVACSGAS